MEDINFKVIEKDEYTIVHFILKDLIEPQILKELKPPNTKGTKGVILSGRGPIWIYSFLVHYYHPKKFIAIFDPRIGGAIIIETHSKNYKVGDIIYFDLDKELNKWKHIK